MEREIGSACCANSGTTSGCEVVGGIIYWRGKYRAPGSQVVMDARALLRFVRVSKKLLHRLLGQG
jgi:hypothetical protein